MSVSFPSAFTYPIRLLAITVVTLVLLLVTSLANAAEETLFLSQQTDLLDAAGGTPIATVAPGTMLNVLEHKDGQVRVELTGWSPEGGESYMFSGLGQRILVARLTDAGLAVQEVVKEQEDDYESLWFDMRLVGWLPEKSTSPDVASVWKAASALFHQRCTRCHALHRPTEFTANQWPAILKIMTVRAGLTGADKALVIQYMQNHAKDGPAKADSAEDEEGIQKIQGDADLAKLGAALYDENGCAGCHGDDAATPADLGYPSLAGQQAEYIFKQISDFQSGARANDEFEVMRGTVGDLSPENIRAISYWLSTLETP